MHTINSISIPLFPSTITALLFFSATARAQVVKPGDVIAVSEAVPNTLRVYDGCSGALKTVFTDPDWLPSGSGRYVEVAPDGTIWVDDPVGKALFQYDRNLSRLSSFVLTFPCVQAPTPSDQIRGFGFDPTGAIYIVGSFQSAAWNPLLKVDAHTGAVLTCSNLSFEPIGVDVLANGLLCISANSSGARIVDPVSGAVLRSINCGGHIGSPLYRVRELSDGTIWSIESAARRVIAFDPALPAGAECGREIDLPADAYPFAQGLDINEATGRLYTFVRAGGEYRLLQYDIRTLQLLSSTPEAPPGGPALTSPAELAVVPSSPREWTVESVAPTTCTNRAINMAIGADGSEHILYYYDNTSGGRGQMRHISRSPGSPWQAGTATIVANNASHRSSLAIDAAGVVYASYSNAADESERLRVLTNGAWSDFGTPLAGGEFWKGGMGGKAALSSSGTPHIAWFYGPSEDAYLADWNGNAWQTTPVATANRVGKGIGLTMTPDGRPVITFYDQDADQARLVERLADGSFGPLETIGAGFPLDAAVDGNGDVWVLRVTPSEQDLVIHRRVAGTWSQDMSFPGSGFGYDLGRLALDSQALPHIVANDFETGRVVYLRTEGGAWVGTTVASGAFGGWGAAIALKADGRAIIAYTRQCDSRVVLAEEGAVLVAPPTAIAGPDQIVMEGDQVALDGSASTSAIEGTPLVFAWTQIAGPTVELGGEHEVQPRFTAPLVPIGGATLTFQLTVEENGTLSHADFVNITVNNVNHPPMADAGPDMVSPCDLAVTLDGSGSTDIDGDALTFEWSQLLGPTVTLADAYGTITSFSPALDGVCGQWLLFQLTVSDGIDAATADVFVLPTFVNHPPVANAGHDLSAPEGTSVVLDGSASSDPDFDQLSWFWVQTSGPPVQLSDPAAATPSFVAPATGIGGVLLSFTLYVDDGSLSAQDEVLVRVSNVNGPPDCSAARADPASLWPANHKLVPVRIVGVTDPDGSPMRIEILEVTQDEGVNGCGEGDSHPDAVRKGSTVLLRAERDEHGDGRVYTIRFRATDQQGGSCEGTAQVVVPRNRGREREVHDHGTHHDSTHDD